MSKPAPEHVIVVNLAMNFPEINRFGGSRVFIARRIVLHLYPHANSLCLFRGTGPPLSVLVPTGGGDSKYYSVLYDTDCH